MGSTETLLPSPQTKVRLATRGRSPGPRPPDVVPILNLSAYIRVHRRLIPPSCGLIHIVKERKKLAVLDPPVQTDPTGRPNQNDDLVNPEARQKVVFRNPSPPGQAALVQIRRYRYDSVALAIGCGRSVRAPSARDGHPWNQLETKSRWRLTIGGNGAGVNMGPTATTGSPPRKISSSPAVIAGSPAISCERKATNRSSSESPRGIVRAVAAIASWPNPPLRLRRPFR